MTFKSLDIPAIDYKEMEKTIQRKMYHQIGSTLITGIVAIRKSGQMMRKMHRVKQKINKMTIHPKSK